MADVQPYVPFFASVFSPKALQQFLRYISGLIVSENQTVDGLRSTLENCCFQRSMTS